MGDACILVYPEDINVFNFASENVSSHKEKERENAFAHETLPLFVRQLLESVVQRGIRNTIVLSSIIDTFSDRPCTPSACCVVHFCGWHVMHPYLSVIIYL